jgi:carboxyl-terminal processing protease
VRGFSINQSQWKFFEQMATKDSISLTAINTKEKATIEKILKSSIARQLFRTEGYFESLNEDDPFIKKALEIIK